MLIKPKHHHFYWQLLLLLFSSFSCFIPVFIGVANAQETVEAANPTSEAPIAQAQSSQPTQRRLKNPFFEEERKLRFGYGGFLESALDGADNFFAADSITNLSNVNINAPPIPGAQTIPGVLSVLSRNKNDTSNFLTTTFNSPDINNPSVVNLQFTNPIYGADPRIGTITVHNFLGNLNINNGSRNYSGSFSVNDNRVSGAVQLVDPKNPGVTILIQLPPTIIQNVNNDNNRIDAPAVLTIGLPTDR